MFNGQSNLVLIPGSAIYSWGNLARYLTSVTQVLL